MDLAVGAVLEGKVTGITKFGAFVTLEGGKSGLVHISEIANTFVSNIADHIQVGQTVKVRVLNIGEDGKINLSIKRAEERPRREGFVRRDPRPQTDAPTERPQPRQEAAPAPKTVNTNSGNQDFEDRLKRFMQESDSRIADNRMYSDHRQRTRRR